MDPACKRMIKEILPAVRASIAIEMKERYDYRQDEIAKILGVAQVAVSKYLNKKQSDVVGRIASHIQADNLSGSIVEEIRT